MAAIKSDFPNLPDDKDPNQAVIFRGILNGLEARGIPLPDKSPKTLKRADMLAHLQTIAGDLIRKDLDADGKRDGAARVFKDARTNEDVAAAFNEFRAEVFVGLPFAPNTITADDVAAAKKG